MNILKIKTVAIYRGEIQLCENRIKKLQKRLPENLVTNADFKLKGEIQKIANYKQDMEQQLETLTTEIDVWLNTCNDISEDLKDAIRYFYVEGHSKLDTQVNFPYAGEFITKIGKYCRGF